MDLDVAGSSPVAHPKYFLRFQLINFGATPSSSLNLETFGNSNSSSFPMHAVEIPQVIACSELVSFEARSAPIHFGPSLPALAVHLKLLRRIAGMPANRSRASRVHAERAVGRAVQGCSAHTVCHLHLRTQDPFHWVWFVSDAARLRYRTGAWVNGFIWSRLVEVRRGGAPHRPGNRDLYGN